MALLCLLVQGGASDSLVSEQGLGEEEVWEVVWMPLVELEAGDLLDGRLPEVLWRKHLVG